MRRAGGVGQIHQKPLVVPVLPKFRFARREAPATVRGGDREIIIIPLAVIIDVEIDPGVADRPVGDTTGDQRRGHRPRSFPCWQRLAICDGLAWGGTTTAAATTGGKNKRPERHQRGCDMTRAPAVRWHGVACHRRVRRCFQNRNIGFHSARVSWLAECHVASAFPLLKSAMSVAGRHNAPDTRNGR